MNHPASEKIVAVSHHFYRLLLMMCHSEFRRRHGREMGQVFRDRCRKAWQQGGPAALVWWWVRALIDLAATVVATHVYAFEQGDVEMKRILLIIGQGIFGCGGFFLLIYMMVKSPLPGPTAGILLCGAIGLHSAALLLHWANAFRSDERARK